IETIATRRARMADRLLFDVVLHAGGLHDPADYFPPSNQDTLRELLKKIDGLKFDSLKRDCLVYSLLKWHRDGREKVFREERCIPPQFSALSDAYWHLDAGVEVQKAVSILSDVRLNRDYTSKILQALSLDPSPYPLILRYVRTSKPLLTEPDDIERYTIALAESNIADAWNYQRTFPEETRGQDFPSMRSRLLRRIIWWCLERRRRLHFLSWTLDH
ncbi:uncharacterized protein STEHIDRAFT_53382, partial [Stereum hirsutum FP-91666 SS1]|uniref:uncharacterized protein n=1 Tax=Stereum hirsutum (strain FP-91666) TaxID=721885 RepID=UPI000440EB26